MHNRSTLWLCAVFLAIGVMLGLWIDSRPLFLLLRAQAYDTSARDELFRELDANSNPLLGASNVIAQIAEVATPSVVHIKSQREVGRGQVEETGSGVVVSSSRSSGTMIVTNRHVVADADLEDIAIQLYDGRVLRPTRVLTDRLSDVAALLVDVSGVPAARWGDSDKVKIGDMVVAIGSPFGLNHSITFGIISAKGRRSLHLGSPADVLNQDFLQTDAAINPGSSGGPLIDRNGRVIGINTAIASQSGGNDGIGFSIPSNLVQRIVDELLDRGAVNRAYLGVKLDSSFNASVASRLKLDRLRGARIVEVYGDTPASKAGLQFDDVVLSFEGTSVQDENHLINLVSLTPIGRTIKLDVMRNGSTIQVDVLLTERPPQ